MGFIVLLVAAMMALSAGTGHAGSWVPGKWTGSETSRGSVSERINPDGSCELVDAAGVPLYDSQFSQRTGSDSCDQ